MPLYSLDTDTLTLLRARHPVVAARVAATPPADVAITVISVEEQLNGWYTLLRRSVRAEQLERAYGELGAVVPFLAGFPILNFVRPAIARFDILRRLRINVKSDDLRIAAIALEAGATVVTRNVRDFKRVPNLTVENWADPPAP